jgi:hypothetical protein
MTYSLITIYVGRFRKEMAVLRVEQCYAVINPLTPELNPSTQRYLTTFFTGNSAS